MVHPWTPDAAALVINQPNTDSLNYHELGLFLAQTHTYVLDAAGTPEADRVPLYPAFIALFYVVFGVRVWIPLLVQIAIGAGTGALLATAAARAFGRTAGLWTAGVYAFAPLQVLYPVSLMSETVFVGLLVLSVFWIQLALCQANARRAGSAAAAGIALGLAALARPAAQFLPVLLAILLLLRFRSHLGTGLRLATVFIAAFLVVIAPWLVRNQQTFGVPALSSNGSYNVLMLYVLPMEMERRHASREDTQAQLLSEVRTQLQQNGVAQANEMMQAQYDQALGLQYIRTYPLPFAKHYTLGVFRSLAGVALGSFGPLLGIPRSDEAFDPWGFGDPVSLIRAWLAAQSPRELALAAFIAAYAALTYVLSTAAVVLFVRRLLRRAIDPDRVWPVVLWVVCALYFILLTGPGGDARYRVPSEPFLLALAAVLLSRAIGHAHPTAADDQAGADSAPLTADMAARP